MNIRFLPAAIVLMATVSTNVFAECNPPATPRIPTGENATASRMLTAQEDVKTFIAQGRQYLACIQSEEAALAKDASDNERNAIIERYNNMVDKMKTASEDYNEAVSTYKKSLAAAD